MCSYYNAGVKQHDRLTNALWFAAVCVQPVLVKAWSARHLCNGLHSGLVVTVVQSKRYNRLLRVEMSRQTTVRIQAVLSSEILFALNLPWRYSTRYSIGLPLQESPISASFDILTVFP
jgi:hypothetical protein